MTKGKFFVGEHSQRRRLWAAVDPQTINADGRVEDLRFAAFLAPFKSKEAARHALIAAGGVVADG
jgi:hypothetical protein